MNEHFVNIKVDREERPDLDQIYMAAVQAMTGHGGWPMSVFLTPDLKPFYGGTYFPPDRLPRDARLPARAPERRPRPGTSGGTRSSPSAGEMTEQLRAIGTRPGVGGRPRRRRCSTTPSASSRAAFDPPHGGFGDAPKFPHPMDLKVLLRQHARTGDAHALHMVRHTLDKMARGGIYDHLGGGFARYSTDDRWLVPHFEKMLYDNALLASVYLEAYQAHPRPRVRPRGPRDAGLRPRPDDRPRRRRSTRPRTPTARGSRGSTTSGRSPRSNEVLGAERAKAFAYVYDVTEARQLGGQNILNLPKPIAQAAKLLGRDEAELAGRARRGPREAAGRARAPRPAGQGHEGPDLLERPDDRRAGRGRRDPGDDRYLEAAGAAAGFLLDRMRTRRRPAAAHVTRTARPSSTAISTTTPT